MTFISRLYRPKIADRQPKPAWRRPPQSTKPANKAAEPITLESVAPAVRKVLHDANNSLSIMCVAGFLLEDVKAGCATTETIIKDLTDIKAAGTRLTQLLKQLQSIIKQSKADIETEAVYPTKSTPPYLANILVVDDEPVCRGTASGVLRKKGHTVTGAANPTEALALLAQKHFDLVITDVDMGEEINGLGLLEIIKQNYPGTNVIVMSGEAATDRAEEAMTKGASAFIAKPFESAALLPIVNGCLPEK